jgi:hypothetical protein
MQLPFKHRRPALRALWPAMLLAMAAGLSGCYAHVEEAGAPEVFCGIFYSCGSDSDTNRGGEQTATGSSSSSSSSGASSTSGESTTTPAGE